MKIITNLGCVIELVGFDTKTAYLQVFLTDVNDQEQYLGSIDAGPKLERFLRESLAVVSKKQRRKKAA